MQLAQGSFAGIPFFTSQANTQADRRVAQQALPYLNNPYIDDLGAQAIQYQLDLFVLGDNHLAERNALLSAFRAGVGELVHPYYGSLQVIASQVRVVDSSTHQRQSKLQVTFVAVTGVVPPPTVDNAAAVKTAAKQTSNNAQSAFENDFKSPQTAAEAQQITNDVQSLLTSVKQINDKISAFTAPIYGLAQDITNLSNEVATLIRTPRMLASSLISMVLSAFSAINDIQAAFGALGLISTNNTSLVSANALPLTQVFATALAIAHAEQLTTAITKNAIDITATDAQTFEHAIGRRIKDAQQNADDATYQALADLAAATHAHVQASLPTLTQLHITNQTTPLPMLVLTYHHTGNVDTVDTQTTRNKIAHPLFAQGQLDMVIA